MGQPAQDAEVDEVMDPIRIGVLGMGVAGRLGASAAIRSSLCSVVAVCDLVPDVTVAAAEVYGARPVHSLEDLARDPEVEAVYVATPTHFHLENARLLASAGKHLLIEKPVVVNREEGRQLVELERSAGVRVMAVNTRGRDAPVRAMARLVREGAIGAIRSLTNISYTSWLLRPRFAYELSTELGGGVIFRQAPHQIEIARTIIGQQATAVSAIAHIESGRTKAVDSYNALLEFGDDVAATLVYSGAGYFDSAEMTFNVGETGAPFEPTAFGQMHATKSWAMDKYGAPAVAARSKALGLGGPTKTQPSWGFAGFTIVSGDEGDLRQSPTGVTVYDAHGPREVDCTGERGGLEIDFEEFYAALRLGAWLQHDALWGVTTVGVFEAIWNSHQTRSRVSLA
jgi:phthalate 4,5-cis-dihydrodiol dehydrogenase